MKLNEIAALNTRAARGPRGKPGRDEHVRISPEDATAGFLEDKLQAGDGIRLHKRERNGSEALVIDAVVRGGFGGGGGGGGGGGNGNGAHPNLAAHDTLGLATQTELDAHDHDAAYEASGAVSTHEGDTAGHLPVYIQGTDPALPPPQQYLWVDTNTDFLWYNDGQVG